MVRLLNKPGPNTAFSERYLESAHKCVFLMKIDTFCLFLVKPAARPTPFSGRSAADHPDKYAPRSAALHGAEPAGRLAILLLRDRDRIEFIMNILFSWAYAVEEQCCTRRDLRHSTMSLV